MEWEYDGRKVFKVMFDPIFVVGREAANFFHFFSPIAFCSWRWH